MGTVTFILLCFAVYLQHAIDPQRHQFEPKITNVNTAVQQLPIEFALGAATGFREAIAGLLWVRTDEFFDEGNYDAIVPMVRIVTWLDPHFIDVYETGAWHLDYNFTDSDQRSDRRYVPIAISLLEEGIANNPDEPGMYADLAFTHFYRKVEDFPQSVYWYEQGQKALVQSHSLYDVSTVGHGLAHAYAACGEIDKAIAEWAYCVKLHKEDLAANPKDFSQTEGIDIAQKNMDELIMRKKWRPIMTKPPLDVKFDATVTRIAPMVLQITGHIYMTGSKSFVLETGQHTFGDVDGCRVELRLQDADYQYPTDASFGLNTHLDKSTTILQDAMSVRNDTFSKKIDMSKDHYGSEPMYPLASPKYTLTLWFNPASENDSPVFVGDRIGWMGEGMTDKHYLDTTGQLPGTLPTNGQPCDYVPGLRLIKKTFVLSRDDIMDSGLATFTK
jgi:tetratricopeptide (TPR) repeat protein